MQGVSIPCFVESFDKSHSVQQLEWSHRLVKISQIHGSSNRDILGAYRFLEVKDLIV